MPKDTTNTAKTQTTEWKKISLEITCLERVWQPEYITKSYNSTIERRITQFLKMGKGYEYTFLQSYTNAQ